MDDSAKQRAIDQMASASNHKVENAAKKLRTQWGANGNCLHSNWDALARSVGLSNSEIESLKLWVTNNNLRPPTKKQVSGKLV